MPIALAASSAAAEKSTAVSSLVFMIIFIIVALAVGTWVLVNGIRMRKNGNLPDFMVAEEERNKVKDRAGFARDIAPSIIIMGIVLIALGIELILNVTGVFSAIGTKARFIDGVYVGLFLISFLFFTSRMGKCREKYIVTGLK